VQERGDLRLLALERKYQPQRMEDEGGIRLVGLQRVGTDGKPGNQHKIP
jgi:hypothetical protein